MFKLIKQMKMNQFHEITHYKTLLIHSLVLINLVEVVCLNLK